MSTVHNLTVILDRNINDEDAESIIHAISMLRGVAQVETGEVEDLAVTIARTQVHQELRAKIFALLADSKS